MSTTGAILGAAHRRNNAFDPLSLFAGGEQGVIYDVQNLSSMFQDSAGTTPAVVDSPVGRINDLSGNGNHAVQATSGKRPILRQDFTGYYLAFDGTDDFLRVAFTIAQPWTRLSQLDPRTWVSNTHIISGATSFGGALFKYQSAPALDIYSGSFFTPDTNTIYNPGAAVHAVIENQPTVMVEIHNGSSSRLGVNQYISVTGAAGSTAPGGITIGATWLDASGSLRLYGIVEISRSLTSLENESVQWWLTRSFQRNVSVDGDSNTVADISFAYQFKPNAAPPIYLQNLAVSGTGLDTNSADLIFRTTEIDARIPMNKRGRQYVYFPWWNNNMPTGANYLTPLVPRTQAQMASAVASFLQVRKAAGWDKVGIGTLCERTDAGQSNVATRGAYNAIVSAPGWIQSNGIDFLVDFAAQPIVGAVGASLDPLLCSDGVHWTALGQSYLETVFRAAINAL